MKRNWRSRGPIPLKVEFKDSVDGLDEFASSEESVSDEGEWMYVAFTELELAGDEELTQ